MRKLFVTLACLLATSMSLSAQESEKEISFGIRLGVNISDYAVKECSMEDKMGFNVGAFVDIPLIEYLSLQPGVTIAMYGKSEGTLHYSNLKESDDYSYSPIVIQVPVLLNYQFKLANKIGLNVQAGPYISYMDGSSNGTYYSDGQEGNVEQGQRKWRVDDKDATSGEINKSVDYGIVVGAGIEMNKMSLGVQYHYGLADFSKVPLAEMKNRTVAICVGYNF